MAYINDELNNKVRHEFYMFFYFHEEYGLHPIGEQYVTLKENEWLPTLHSLGIYDFTVLEKEEKIEIRISLERPGILIGVHGRLITGLVKYLTEMMKKEVKFNIIESTMWSFSTKSVNKILDTELRS